MTSLLRSLCCVSFFAALACDDEGEAIGPSAPSGEDAGGAGSRDLEPPGGMGPGGTGPGGTGPGGTGSGGTGSGGIDAGSSSGGLDAGAQADLPDAAASLFPADWCVRAGADELARANTLVAIVVGYSMAQSTDCATAGLTSGLDGTQGTSWFNYLLAYTDAMAGCPPQVPVDGGILAFGPGNTPAAGAARPDLGADDVTRLTAHYVAAFGDALELNQEERAAVTAHLLLTAQTEIDAEASAVLSTCGGSTDAGL